MIIIHWKDICGIVKIDSRSVWGKYALGVMEEMLVKFDYFYGGHIGFSDIGFDATPVDDRVVTNQKLASVFEETKSMALVMDKLGFDTLWLSEHHFQSEGYGGIPNIPMTSVYLANVTEKLNYGGFFNTVPAWHPL